MDFFYIEIENNILTNGFFNKDIHGIEKCNLILKNGGIKLTNELRFYILNNECFEFKGTISYKTYNINDKDLFLKVENNIPNENVGSSADEKNRADIDYLAIILGVEL